MPEARAASPGNAAVIAVEVIHAGTDGVSRRQLRLPAGSTVAQAVIQSGLAALLPAGTAWQGQVGIYGRRCMPDQTLRDADRVELYRPLQRDPMDSRRRRAQLRRQKSLVGKPE